MKSRVPPRCCESVCEAQSGRRLPAACRPQLEFSCSASQLLVHVLPAWSFICWSMCCLPGRFCPGRHSLLLAPCMLASTCPVWYCSLLVECASSCLHLFLLSLTLLTALTYKLLCREVCAAPWKKQHRTHEIPVQFRLGEPMVQHDRRGSDWRRRTGEREMMGAKWRP